MVSGAAVVDDVGGGRPQRLRLPSVTRAAVVGGVLFLGYVVLVFHGPDGLAETVSGIGFPATALIYVPLAALAAIRTRGRLRAAWLVMTVAQALDALGDLLSAVYRHTLGEVPGVSWVDVAYLSSILLVAVSLLLFPSSPSWVVRSRMFLDGVLVTASFFLISWLTVMRDAWAAEEEGALEFALSIAYPAGQALVLTLALLVLVRSPRGIRPTMALLVSSLTCSFIGDTVWAYVDNESGYGVGSVADIFYAASIVLLVVAFLCGLDARPDLSAEATRTSRLSLWLPLLPVAVAAVFVALAPLDAVFEPPVIVAGSVLIGATLVRQFLESAELVRRERQVRKLADRLNGELDSASHYVESILPGPLDGPVQVSSRYLPARAVGGDSFGYQWIDDDHLIVYLVDVSGHGVRPALLSVSVHNLLRSGSLTNDVLLQPDAVLSDLNHRFSMEGHDGHYFTMWFGVYRLSTGELRYANAGHPPPLLLTTGVDGTVRALSLDMASMPVGMFPDADFTTETRLLPMGSRLLLYSDGALGDAPHIDEFVAACTELPADTPDWLDSLIGLLPVAPDGHIEDDCSLVMVNFPAPAKQFAGAVSS